VSTERNHAIDTTVSTVNDLSANDNVIDLYSTTHEKSTRTTENPFVYQLLLHSTNREITRVKALFDGGAMVGAMCSSIFRRIQHRLGSWCPSQRRLRMANGAIVRSQAVWKGIMELGGIRIEGKFEVFDSDHGWGFLFGKPLLHAFSAVHDYGTDIVTISNPAMTTVVRLCNQINNTLSNTVDKQGISLMLDVKQWEDLSGGSSEMNPPSRQVPTSPKKWYEIPFDKHEAATAITHVQKSALQMNTHEAIFKNASNMHNPQDTIAASVVEDSSPSMLPQANNQPHVIETGGIEQPP
jgi:hypothetical protein